MLRDTSQRSFDTASGTKNWLINNHVAAVALYVAHYNFCRVHEALRMTPAKAIGVASRTWTIAELVEAAINAAPPMPTETPPDRRRKFVVIQGGKG